MRDRHPNHLRLSFSEECSDSVQRLERKSHLVIAPASHTIAILVFSASTEREIAMLYRLVKKETSLAARTCLVHPWLAAAAWKAFKTTSTILWDVKTLPPQTAAVRDGDNSDFGGIMTEQQS